MKEEQKDFIENYQGKEPKQDRLYLDIELRARKRYNKLFEDAMKEETDRLSRLVDALYKQFKMEKEDIRDLMSGFGGTTEKLYYHIARVQGMNIDNIKTLNKWGISSAG